MKKSELELNIISNSWDDFVFNTEEKRIEIKSRIDENCSYIPCRGVVLMVLNDEVIGGNSFKKVLGKYAYILFWEENIPSHLREEYRLIIEESAKHTGLTAVIDFIEFNTNSNGSDNKSELLRKLEEGYEINENIDTVAWVSSLGIKIQKENSLVSLVKHL